MDTPTLVKEQIEGGRKLLAALDREGFPLDAALWWYAAEAEEWRFLLATPLVESQGPREVYQQIQAILQKLPPEERLPLASISVVSPNDERIRSLRRLLRTGPGVSSVRLSKSVVDNLFIEDAYVYRVS